jgi:PhnB protein
MKINPSLMFSGGCGDAFGRYASLFGGEIVFMLTWGESPAASQVPDDWHSKVWFARLRAGGMEFTGADLVASEPPTGFSLVAGVGSPDEADRVFAGLAADGGEVLMPLQETPWSPRYGVVRDPFGIRWEINSEASPATL